MVSRSSFAVAAFVAALAVAAPARAQEKGAPRLQFTGAPGCPDEASFRSSVAVFFDGFDPFDANAPDVVSVTFTKIPGGYRGAVQYTPKAGAPWPPEEKIGAPCALLFQSVARLASLRVPDPPPPVAPEPAEPAPPPPEPVSKPSEPSPPKGPAPWAPPPVPRFSRLELLRPADDMPYTIVLSGFGLMTAGYADSVSSGVQLAAEVRSVKDEDDVFRLGLEFRGLLPSKVYLRESTIAGDTRPVDSSRYRELDISQFSALLVPCYHWKYLLGCGVVEGGVRLSATTDETRPAWTFSLGPRVGVEVPVAERFALRAFGEALFVPDSESNSATVPSAPGEKDAPNVRWRQSVVSGFFGVGVSVKFE